MTAKWCGALAICGVLWLSTPALAQTPVPGRTAPPSSDRLEAGELRIGWSQMGRLFRGMAAVPMYALVGCGILAVAFAAERLVVLTARRVAPPAFTKRVLQHLRDETLSADLTRELLAACRRDASPAAKLLGVVIENHGRSALEIRTAVSDVADIELFDLRKHVRAIAGLAGLAPLLGLFGTVIGMIEAFQALSLHAGPGKTEFLAAGIGLALMATAGGLGVAIFASACYYFMLGRVDRRVHELDLLTNQAVVLVASDTVKEVPRKVRAAATPEPARVKQTG